MTGIIALVHRSDDPDGPFMTIAEVAKHFNRDRTTIRKWCKKIGGIPSHKMPLGDGSNPNSFVWLYTEGDLNALAKHCDGINPKGGRPKKDKSRK